jgi:CheY-like chemotaxis protein
MKILITDDSLLIRKVLIRILSSEGHDLSEACTGKEACELTEKDSFDLIFMDLNMPVMGGVEAIKIITSKYDIPIVAISALDNQSEEIFNAIDAGAKLFLKKPFDKNGIIKAVKSFDKKFDVIDA